MISPFLYVEKQKIRGKGITICKVDEMFEMSSSQPNQEKKCVSKSKREHLEKGFLTNYLVFKKTSLKPVGWLNLKEPLGQFGEVALKYNFQETLSEHQKIEIFRTFLGYIQKFYGLGFDADQQNTSSNIFQEVRIVLSRQEDLVLLLKSGFKISRVMDSTLILRHRYEDQTGIGYDYIENLELKKEDFCSIVRSHHFLKLEEAVLRRELLQGEDLNSLKWYLKEKEEALSYYLFLIGDNFKLYLNYAKVMTTIKGIYN